MVRVPRADRRVMEAPSATAVAGISAAGSPSAIDPPIVPRLRVW